MREEIQVWRIFMEVSEFQQKLVQLSKFAADNDKKLTVEQIQSCFNDSGLDSSQMLKVIQYLKKTGIEIEGVSIPSTETEVTETPSESTTPLTLEEQQYLDLYMNSLEKSTEDPAALWTAFKNGDFSAQTRLIQFYMPFAAQRSAELNCEEIPLQDLIQEANVSLLMAFEEELPASSDPDTWIKGRITAGIRLAIEEQTQRKSGDDILVSKVQKLEAAVKDLTDDDEETKFSVDELAIFLDMNVDEIRDVLRLTGDDK